MHFILTIWMGLLVSAQMPEEAIYQRDIQPIFDSRCIACHSCFNAPCQLNLQNYDGFQRGATKQNIYNGTRTSSVAPTRLWVDAHSVAEWRAKGFFEVNTSLKPEENLFFKVLKWREQNPHQKVTKTVTESMTCADSAKAADTLSDNAELGMPYGFPALNKSQLSVLQKWIQSGAPGSVPTPQIHANTQKQIRDWEKFFNNPKGEHQLVSRYIFEHLFLAHIHFPEDNGQFFRLIRSSKACEKNPLEIATRRPNEDPGVKRFYYCLIPFTGTPVFKTHIPFAASTEKLKKFEEIFFSKSWHTKKLPSYENMMAANPFVTFKDIPVRARYRFLLEDSQYHVSTFIKGPVCNGSNAVNSIQEQFYVFFLDPEADGSLHSASYAKSIAPLLILPGVFGSEVEIKETAPFTKELIEHRERYRSARYEDFKKRRPDGYVLNDVWNGDGNNPNAVLTVMRHDDNAVVVHGAWGDLSKTIFMLDYPLFERLVYNLVVNFDVFGNVGHQFLTRVYMDMIRMEAEAMFLMFLPPETRLQLRQTWYRGLLTEVKMKYMFSNAEFSGPTAVKFENLKDPKRQMVEKILFSRLSAEARGKTDPLNWKTLTPKGDGLSQDKIQSQLREIASVAAADSTPFARYFPDMAYVKIHTGQGLRVYSIIHHKEHENISWILAESLRMAPEEDSLTIVEGFLGAYPNMIFDVQEKDLGPFVNAIKKIRSGNDYEKVVSRFGIRRTNSKFWLHYDELTAHQKRSGLENFGYLDLTRYSLN